MEWNEQFINWNGENKITVNFCVILHKVSSTITTLCEPSVAVQLNFYVLHELKQKEELY